MQHTSNLARTNFDVIFKEAKKVLSASSSYCGPLPLCALLRVPPDDEKPTRCSEICIENSASVWIFGSLLTNSQRRPKSDGARNFAQGGK